MANQKLVMALAELVMGRREVMANQKLVMALAKLVMARPENYHVAPYQKRETSNGQLITINIRQLIIQFCRMFDNVKTL
ncbi:hypothetical protein I2483_05640 [Sporosarcina sp. E16_3]|uniref:hypothetical protein n=1 Tax=Sporosarcina sp. E16_3 TaxID=2789293 RepID=UPI001A919417|nr:hypothetical protein [Sporosarcina sp. E16_3]MBO0601136.1 hypothetical protein [Sporosarcina sp. E16_3]